KVNYVYKVFIVGHRNGVKRGSSNRNVTIEMPGGRYDAGEATVHRTGDTSVVAQDDFQDVARHAIDDFGRAEPRWSSFGRKPHCAEPDFKPLANTLKLHKDQTGQVAVAAKSRLGGNATEARWTLLGEENARFSPTSSEQPTPSFSYTVTNAPDPGFV